MLRQISKLNYLVAGPNASNAGIKMWAFLNHGPNNSNSLHGAHLVFIVTYQLV